MVLPLALTIGGLIAQEIAPFGWLEGVGVCWNADETFRAVRRHQVPARRPRMDALRKPRWQLWRNEGGRILPMPNLVATRL